MFFVRMRGAQLNCTATSKLEQQPGQETRLLVQAIDRTVHSSYAEVNAEIGLAQSGEEALRKTRLAMYQSETE
jgi:hypothetical protein